MVTVEPDYSSGARNTGSSGIGSRFLSSPVFRASMSYGSSLKLVDVHHLAQCAIKTTLGDSWLQPHLPERGSRNSTVGWQKNDCFCPALGALLQTKQTRKESTGQEGDALCRRPSADPLRHSDAMCAMPQQQMCLELLGKVHAHKLHKRYPIPLKDPKAVNSMVLLLT